MPPQNQQPPAPAPQNSSWGPTIGITMVVLLLAIGGAYFFYTQAQEAKQNAEQAQLQAAQESQQTTPANPEDSLQSELDASATGSAQGDVDALGNSL
ncbi:hypothetical protein EXS62_01670 [Candidatus Kaiserbacteria bacterium]|nr:hypothetical protein [Candidatus Kaiserbacteria bacterium]